MEMATKIRLVILETPFKGSWIKRIFNKRYARACMKHSLERGEAPYASHLLYTQPGVLRDRIPKERRQGIYAALAWGLKADATVVYVDRGLSDGMKMGIAAARTAGRPVEYRTLYPRHAKNWDLSWGDPHIQ